MRIILLASLLIFFSSCKLINRETVKGDGNIVNREISVEAFSSIDVRGALVVYVKQEGVHKIRVKTDANLIPHLEINSVGGVLEIGAEDGFNLDPTYDIYIYVSAPSFRDLEVSGASEIIGENQLSGNESVYLGASGASIIELDLNFPAIEAELSGSSHMVLKGKSDNLMISGSGASTIKAFELVTENADIDVSGASDIDLYANRSIIVDASGASNINYKGNAAVTQTVSGAGSVRKVN